MNLTKTLPSSRVDVLNDPEVVAAYPVGAVLAEQGGYNLDRYASPYDWIRRSTTRSPSCTAASSRRPRRTRPPSRAFDS